MDQCRRDVIHGQSGCIQLLALYNIEHGTLNGPAHMLTSDRLSPIHSDFTHMHSSWERFEGRSLFYVFIDAKNDALA